MSCVLVPVGMFSGASLVHTHNRPELVSLFLGDFHGSVTLSGNIFFSWV